MRLDYKDWTNLLLFIGIVILIFIIVVKIQGEGVQCTLNPLEFGAKQLREQNKREIMCQCNLLTENPSPTLYFNHNSSRFERPSISEIREQFDVVNFSFAEDLVIDHQTSP